MTESLIKFKGRDVSRDNFRAFVYAKNGGKMIAENFKDYNRHLESGHWFESAKVAFDAAFVEDKQKDVENITQEKKGAKKPSKNLKGSK